MQTMIPGDRIDTGRRLVEDDDLGAADESDGDANPAPDALRQVPDRPVLHLLDLHRLEEAAMKGRDVLFEQDMLKDNKQSTLTIFWWDGEGAAQHRGSRLVSHPAAPGLVLGFPNNFYLNVAEIYLLHCLEQ